MRANLPQGLGFETGKFHIQNQFLCSEYIGTLQFLFTFPFYLNYSHPRQLYEQCYKLSRFMVFFSVCACKSFYHKSNNNKDKLGLSCAKLMNNLSYLKKGYWLNRTDATQF